MTERIWQWNDASEGIVEYPVPNGGCTDMRNVDVSSLPLCVMLGRAMENISGYSLDHFIRRIITTPDVPSVVNPYLFALLGNGKIWRFRQDSTSWTNVYTDPDLELTNGIIYAGRFYWTTGYHLNNISLSGTHSVGITAWGTSEVNVTPYVQRSFASGGSLHPMLVNEGILYIGDGNVIATLDESTHTFTNARLVFPDNETIVALTISGAHIGVYTANRGIPVWGKKYLWDGASTSPLGCVVFDGIPIAQVANRNRMDAVFGGTSRDLGLFISDGYALERLRKLGPLGYQSFVGHGNAVYSGDSLYVGGSQDGILRVFGSTGSGNARSLFPAHTTHADNANDLFTTLAFLGDDLFTGTMCVSGSTTTYHIEKRSITHYSPSGYITSGTHVGSGYAYRKTLRNISIASTTPTNTSIELFASIDDTSFVSIGTVSGMDVVTHIPALALDIPREYSSLTLQAVLSTSDISVTPTLREIVVRYDEIL